MGLQQHTQNSLEKACYKGAEGILPYATQPEPFQENEEGIGLGSFQS